MPAKSFFEKISSGDFGLAKTYWMYWVLVLLMAVNTLMIIRPTTATLVIVALAHVAYLVPVVMGIWRAVNQCEGEKTLAVLAMISVVLGIIGIVLMFVMFNMLIDASARC